ncbi:MAG: hypothetical protein KC502_00395 [Myxococcales bacterium]|nr:hypothetical protein [Myxococcales bacterium]
MEDALPGFTPDGTTVSVDVVASGDVSGDSASAPDTSHVQPDTSPWLADGGCTPGEQLCLGAQLATCGSAGDGWLLSPCFPGQYCEVDSCVPLENNLIIAFDTSGSMNAPVPGKACKQPGFPACSPELGCTRMDVSKAVFLQALKKVDTKKTRLALFRFPQRLARTSKATCSAGYVSGFPTLSGDTASEQTTTAKSSWYWSHLHEIMCVPFPINETQAGLAHLQVDQWMDGQETLKAPGNACAGGGSVCAPDPSCGSGACCSGQCRAHEKPELRAHGGTPIGKTLFYIGEYLRHRVVIDGQPCTSDSACNNPNYRCEEGKCADAARNCRETVVVLFTDGGQPNDPTRFFAPRVAAKRLAFGLGCQSDPDCVGGATCQKGRCLPASQTGYHCVATGSACKPSVSDPKDALHCQTAKGKPSSCLPDVLSLTSATAKSASDNVLRSPDGRPFGVRVHVVDISDSANVAPSYYLASAGRGRLFTASSTDPLAFVHALESAFDMKNQKVCGTYL